VKLAATAFERDAAGMPASWGGYASEAAMWATELLRLPRDAPANEWMDRHPDEKRWIGYKTATYIAD
jgi:hypothetical protein